jgi:hypothetical protein
MIEVTLLNAVIAAFAGAIAFYVASRKRAESQRAAKEAARLLELKKQRIAYYPSPYPNGWYCIAYEFNVSETPQEVLALGKGFCLYKVSHCC